MKGLAAIFGFLVPNLVATEPWLGWKDCPTAALAASEARRLAPIKHPVIGADKNNELYESKYRIVSINASDGNLLLNPYSDIWESIKATKEDIKVIVNFGAELSGKSVISSFLGCTMNRDEAILFPSHFGGVGGRYTEGIWASAPFDYTGEDGVTSKYMILDLQSINRVADYHGLSSARTNNALYKMVAMLTEIASVFVYSVKATQFDTSDIADIGLLFETTRQNILSRSADDAGDPAPINGKNLRALNKPRLILVPRIAEQNMHEIVDPTKFAINAARDSEVAKTLLADITADNDAFLTVLEANFDNITHGKETLPWGYVSLPVMSQAGDNEVFRWGTRDPYDWEDEGACKRLDRMTSLRWECKITTGSGATAKKVPASPPVYKLAMDKLVKTIHADAEVRVLNNQDEEPISINGERLEFFLKRGIVEMNAAGPLPRTELWRRMMQDRCNAELRDRLEFIYGEGTGKVDDKMSTGLLIQIDEGLSKIRKDGLDEEPAKAAWRPLKEQWDQRPDFDSTVDAFFANSKLMDAVRPTCIKVAADRDIHFENVYGRLKAEWTALIETIKRQAAEARVRELENQVAALQAELDWEENKIYYLFGAAVGVCALLCLMRWFGQCQTVCKTCFSCCGGDKNMQASQGPMSGFAQQPR